MRLLLVEDDQMLGASLQKALENNAYGVDWVQDGEAAELILETSQFGGIILDINLPKQSGLQVLAALRSKGLATPVLLLTAQNTPVQKVQGLDMGADDYLAKPFDLTELLARLRALIRRSGGRSDPILRSGNIELDPAATIVRKNGKAIIITAKEFRLLKLLMERADKFVTKGDIEYALYNVDDMAESNTIEVTIYNLRKKLGNEFIQTIRGVGYRVTA